MSDAAMGNEDRKFLPCRRTPFWSNWFPWLGVDVKYRYGKVAEGAPAKTYRWTYKGCDVDITDNRYGIEDASEDERKNTIAHNGNDGDHYDVVMTPEEEAEYGPKARSKYHVEIRPGVFVDVYDVLHAFGVTNPGDQHAIKKLLKPGQRGYKDANQDRREAIASIERGIELEPSQ